MASGTLPTFGVSRAVPGRDIDVVVEIRLSSGHLSPQIPVLIASIPLKLDAAKTNFSSDLGDVVAELAGVASE